MFGFKLTSAAAGSSSRPMYRQPPGARRQRESSNDQRTADAVGSNATLRRSQCAAAALLHVGRNEQTVQNLNKADKTERIDLFPNYPYLTIAVYLLQ